MRAVIVAPRAEPVRPVRFRTGSRTGLANESAEGSAIYGSRTGSDGIFGSALRARLRAYPRLCTERGNPAQPVLPVLTIGNHRRNTP